MLRGLLSLCAALGAATVSFVSSVPAFAGHYNVVYTCPGMSPSTTSASRSASDSRDGGSPSASVSCSVVATFTWVSDPNAADDPPPSTVYVQETARAAWTGKGSYCGPITGNQPPVQHVMVFQGTADNGIGSPSVSSKGDGGPDCDGATSSGEKTTKTSGGASFTITRSLQATASGDAGPNGSGTITVNIDYSANIIDGSAHASASFDVSPDTTLSPGWTKGPIEYTNSPPSSSTFSVNSVSGGVPGLSVNLPKVGLSADISVTATQYYQYTGSGTRPDLAASGYNSVEGGISHKVFTASSSARSVLLDASTALSGSAPNGEGLTYAKSEPFYLSITEGPSMSQHLTMILKAKASTK